MKSRIFCAIDTTDIAHARTLAKQLQGHIGGLKLGLEFFVSNGPEGVRTFLEGQDLPLFLDLKFHDIPNTVAGALRAALALQPRFVNVHTSGGLEMMKRAANTIAEESDKQGIIPPKLLGVTVLTSLNDQDLQAVGQTPPASSQVLKLATLAHQAGIDGVVCSPHEITTLRTSFPDNFILMVPGIRPIWAQAQDQKRAMTPHQAVQNGTDYLVIGRPITQHADPAHAADLITAEMEKT